VSSGPPPLIVHVIHHLVIGGMENGLVNLVNNMPVTRYRHVIACIEDYSSFRQRIARSDVDVIALHRSRVGHRRLRWRLFRLFRKLRPAIVHSRNLSGLDALLPARLAQVAHCVHGEHGWDMGDPHGRKWKPALLRRLHAPLVDRYITVSQDLQRYLIERVGIRTERISQIYNGVDVSRFNARRDLERAWLPENFRGSGRIVIGTVGRMQRVKDQTTLIRAFAALVARRPEWRNRVRLLMVGAGPLLEELQTLAISMGLRDLTLFPGALEDIPRALSAMDVFVLPSINEGISNTILEAMAAGLPVVASAVGGNCELVEDGVSGRLFAAGGVATLEGILESYVDDPGLRAEHGDAARQRAVGRFSLDTMVRRYQETYESLCGSRGTDQA
jgi:sugar transferase (PEP-CTERM/EpsH1 system associated)